MQLNGHSISSRHNRPVVLSKVGLQTIFIQDGEYVDPYEISSVSIYYKNSNISPCSVLNIDNQELNQDTSGSILMNFGNSATLCTDPAFLSTNYVSQNISGIYKIDTGRYMVVLDGTTQNLSGNLSCTFGEEADEVIKNSASTVGNYIDCWTVVMVTGSEPQVFINDFSLRSGLFTTVTEPLIFKAYNKLYNKKITLGSKADVKVATEIHVENQSISEDIRNLLRETLVTNASIQIEKINEELNLPSRVTVSGYSDTTGVVEVLSDNTILYTWDTDALKTHDEVLNGNLGSLQGTYLVRVKYSILNETIISEPMYLILT